MKIIQKNKILLFVCLMLLCVCFVACGKGKAGTYTVSLSTEFGKAMQNVDVRIYTDETKNEIVAAGKTDEKGEFKFESEGAVGNVIVFEGDFRGYSMKEYYEIDKMKTDIVLEVQLLSEVDAIARPFELGDVFADLEVVTSEGETLKISEILKEKKAVVLNFWYLNCAPCKLEFPYLQNAYEQYKEELEVIAVNPLDGTQQKIANLKEEMGLTFPMASISQAWIELMDLSAYPTTVVIDRYGLISYIHTGYINENGVFEKIFDYYVDDDYQHTVIKNLNEFR